MKQKVKKITKKTLQQIKNVITTYAIGRLLAWSIFEYEFNISENPIHFPLFSVLWLYTTIDKKETDKIKNNKIGD